MDLICPKCGEPWDNDCFHDVADDMDSTYTQVVSSFKKQGCQALGTKCNENTTLSASQSAMVSELYDLMGDDVDGAAAILEDAGDLGMWD